MIKLYFNKKKIFNTIFPLCCVILILLPLLFIETRSSGVGFSCESVNNEYDEYKISLFVKNSSTIILTDTIDIYSIKEIRLGGEYDGVYCYTFKNKENKTYFFNKNFLFLVEPNINLKFKETAK